MKKWVLNYLLRVLIFLLLVGFLYGHIVGWLVVTVENVIVVFTENHPIPNLEGDLEGLFNLFAAFFIFITIFPGVVYFFAKITGIFKQLNNLKRWQRFTTLFLITAFCIIFAEYTFKHKILNVDNATNFDFTGYFLIPSYLMYLFLNHMTKKHPFLQKPGHYFSLEPYKRIFLTYFNKKELPKMDSNHR